MAMAMATGFEDVFGGDETRGKVVPAPAAKTPTHPSVRRDIVMRDPGLPEAQGLYDPANEHDACGVGFVANMHNSKSHDIVRMGLEILLNLDHRGATGADPKAGDGCGMLVQIPHDFFVAKAKEAGFELPAPGRLRHRRDVPAQGRGRARRHRGDRRRRRSPRRAAPCSAGATCRSIPRGSARASSRASRRHPPRCSSPRLGRGPGHVRAPAVHPPQGDLEQGVRPRGQALRRLLRRVDVVPDDRLQGPAARGTTRRLFQGPRRPDVHFGARPGAPALLDQHVPVVAAGPPVPLRRPQRRDQHAARQRQLDGGAPGLGLVRPLRRGHHQALADLLRGPVRHGVLRQRARIPGPEAATRWPMP